MIVFSDTGDAGPKPGRVRRRSAPGVRGGRAEANSRRGDLRCSRWGFPTAGFVFVDKKRAFRVATHLRMRGNSPGSPTGCTLHILAIRELSETSAFVGRRREVVCFLRTPLCRSRDGSCTSTWNGPARAYSLSAADLPPWRQRYMFHVTLCDTTACCLVCCS